jgi:CRP/FNR family cyclic AMP-dependent transcriptional regulator
MLASSCRSCRRPVERGSWRWLSPPLASYGKQDKPTRVVPTISQETLVEMIGTTRSAVNFFLNKFKKLGFIEYDSEDPLKINSSLLSVVLHD